MAVKKKPGKVAMKTQNKMSVTGSPLKKPKIISTKPIGSFSSSMSKSHFGRNKSPLSNIWGFIVWLVGILVSLAVGFGMVGKTLMIPYIHTLVTVSAGWIVIVLTLVGVLLKIIDVVRR